MPWLLQEKPDLAKRTKLYPSPGENVVDAWRFGVFKHSKFPKEAKAWLACTMQPQRYETFIIRVLAPVRTGSRVRNHVVLTDFRERAPDRYLQKTTNTLEVEGLEQAGHGRRLAGAVVPRADIVTSRHSSR